MNNEKPGNEKMHKLFYYIKYITKEFVGGSALRKQIKFAFTTEK